MISRINLSKTLHMNYSNIKSKTRIEFFYDIVSPYAWFAFEVLNRYKPHWNIEVELKPVYNPAILHAAVSKPPMSVPNKCKYMVQDVQSCAKYFDLPLKINPNKNPFEFLMEKGSLVPNRLVAAVAVLFPDKLEIASRAVWVAFWSKIVIFHRMGQCEDITSPAGLLTVGKDAGFTNDQIVLLQQAISDQKVKDKLRAYTDEALAYLAFGVPTIVAHIDGEKKLFFGSDRFPILAIEIGEKWLGPNPDATSAKL